MFKIEMIDKITNKKSYFYYQNFIARYFVRTYTYNEATTYNTIKDAISDIKFFTTQCKHAKFNEATYNFNILDCDTGNKYDRNGFNIISIL